MVRAIGDRYRFERELGAGGMASVFLAHDLEHDCEVAIKVLHLDPGAALGGERFLSEIRTTARLQHPHILPLLDSLEAAACCTASCRGSPVKRCAREYAPVTALMKPME